MVLLHADLKLVMALVSAGSSNPDTWGAISRYEFDVMSTYVRLFLVHCAPETLEPYISKPQMEVQNLLCEACYDIPDDILSSASPYDEVCVLCLYFNSGSGKVTYLILFILFPALWDLVYTQRRGSNDGV